MRYLHRGDWQPGLMVEMPASQHRRTAGIGGLLLLLGYSVHRVSKLDDCELIGHDSHWETPTLRICRRCPMTWRRDTGDIAATTTNQPYGW